MDTILKKLVILRHQHFLHWPLIFQRIILLISAFILYLAFTQLLGSQTAQIYQCKANINELNQKLAAHKNIIQQAKLQKDKKAETLLSRVDTLNLSNFMTHVSILAKRNSVEILSIKPLPPKTDEKLTDFRVYPFQIDAVGEYSSLLKFVQHMIILPDLAVIDNFQIKYTEKGLKLTMILDLYGESFTWCAKQSA